MSKVILTVLCVLVFAGCAGPSVRQIDITTDERQIETLHPPLPTGVTWQKVEWTILTPELMRELLAKVESGEIDDSKAVFVALTATGYQNLSVNLADLKRYIEDQQSVIMYYRDNITEEVLEDVEEAKVDEPVEEVEEETAVE